MAKSGHLEVCIIHCSFLLVMLESELDMHHKKLRKIRPDDEEVRYPGREKGTGCPPCSVRCEP